MGIVKKDIIDVLKKYERVLIDTNSFIYFMEDHEAYADILQIVFDMIESGKVYGVSSTLVFTEVLTKPIKMGIRSLKLNIKHFLLIFQIYTLEI